MRSWRAKKGRGTSLRRRTTTSILKRNRSRRFRPPGTVVVMISALAGATLQPFLTVDASEVAATTWRTMYGPAAAQQKGGRARRLRPLVRSYGSDRWLPHRRARGAHALHERLLQDRGFVRGRHWRTRGGSADGRRRLANWRRTAAAHRRAARVASVAALLAPVPVGEPLLALLALRLAADRAGARIRAGWCGGCAGWGRCRAAAIRHVSARSTMAAIALLVLWMAAPPRHLLITGPELIDARRPAVARARSIHIPKAVAMVVDDGRLARGSHFDAPFGRLTELRPPTDLAEDRLASLRHSRRRRSAGGLRRSPGRQSRLLGKATGRDAEHRDRTQSHTFPFHV